jgi:adenylate cyclase
MRPEAAQLDPGRASAGEPARSQAFLFADIAGFTALTEAHGDERAADIVDHFCEHASGLLDRFGGEQVKTIGDAVMIRTESAAAAVRFGIELAHHRMAQHRYPMVGVGIAWGPASSRRGDWIGSTVNAAARIAGVAEQGEVLLSAACHEAAGEMMGIGFRPRDPVSLRGFPRPVEIYEAICEDAAAALYIDPVCRMAVEPERSHGRLTHRGLDYYFCSEDCLRAFRREPDSYTAVVT